jgi:UDP-GlcNAc:undecaprenyl-phosphate GlcNAc-1-phosphate transferase
MNNTIIIYSLLSFLILFLCGKVSYKLNLLDHPNKRKIHTKATAYTGGFAISVILLFSIFLFAVSDKNLNIILSIAFLISIIGLIDDKYNLDVSSKLSLQIIPIFYLIVFENLALQQIGDYNYFKVELGSFVIPFTLMCVLLLINAFNYFDGIDGTLGFTSISVLIILYFLIPNQNFQLFLILILIPLAIFLCFNFSLFKLPKLFLGDSGSLLIGFVIAFALIYLANQNLTHPILLAWSVVIFVYEFLSIHLIRLKNKKDPLKAGQDHLHHLLLNNTKSIFLTNFFISIMNIILFIIGYLSFLLISPLISLILFITFFIIFLILRNNYSK